MENLLSDRSKFVAVDENYYKLTQRLESRLNKTLLTFHIAGKFDRNIYNDLRAVGSSPGKLYGLPKTHKSGVPLRPILSAVPFHNYKLAKFLVPLLSPLATSDYNITNIFEFARDLRSISYHHLFHMISLDIENLFTNVPVTETINIILNKLFPDDYVCYHGFNRDEFRTLLSLAVEHSYFTFNNNLFKQKDGMAMGSPLGPIFANIFLAHNESSWLANAPVTPFLYKRYVDDTLLLVPTDSDVNQLLDHMNSQHPNIRFTLETETNDSLNFLGLTINRKHDLANNVYSFETKVYRKPMHSPLLTNFNSFTPLSYRLTVARSLIYRALQLCSSWFSFHLEVDIIKTMLLKINFLVRL